MGNLFPDLPDPHIDTDDGGRIRLFSEIVRADQRVSKAIVRH